MESKMRQISLGINQSCSNRLRVQIISHLNKVKITCTVVRVKNFNVDLWCFQKGFVFQDVKRISHIWALSTVQSAHMWAVSTVKVLISEQWALSTVQNTHMWALSTVQNTVLWALSTVQNTQIWALSTAENTHWALHWVNTQSCVSTEHKIFICETY